MTTFKAVTGELKDTGINELLKSGIDPLTVMQHADPHLVETIKERTSRF
ncbi:MAG: hypothetical protein MJZ90_11300 [Bacteroidales bacterium]|nr:hypothetical protein [Bacteroidales bacterium]